MQELIQQRFGGSQAQFARAIQRSPSVVWQYLSGHRQIGERFARHVEHCLHLEPGWLDSAATESSAAIQGSGAAANAIQIPIYDVEAAAGIGAFVGSEQVRDRLVVRPDWLRELVGYLPSPERLAIIQVRGDSMEPTLHPGDLLLVDRHPVSRAELHDGIFVLRIDDALLVKRVQVTPGGLQLISDNPRYDRLTVADADIVARVIWAWHGQKF